jgi:hypothetical protein
LRKQNQKAMKNCLECGEKIMGRSDKKFCSDACRNAYNNKLNSGSNNLVRNINNTLRKNRRILEEACRADDKGKISKSALLREGFDFTYFTSIRTTQKGATYIFVYEYGYLLLDNEQYLVVKDRKS